MGPRLKDVEDESTTAVIVNARSLQWGHVSRTWKTAHSPAPVEDHRLASMGPRLKDVEDVGESLDARGVLRASMGPRLKDVEDALGLAGLSHVLTLQWGHVSRTWKTPLAIVNRAVQRHASMGPRLKDVEDRERQDEHHSASPGFNGATSQGRGRHATDDRRVRLPGQASMGPRLKDVEDTMEAG